MDLIKELKDNVSLLISLYEKEQLDVKNLNERVKSLEDEIDAKTHRINELTKKLNNLEVAKVISLEDTTTAEAKAELEKMIRQVDQCIKLLES
ncbi:MAG TPA: hypothetical protein DHU75_07575 [Rikenellaceae bacterium]|nr:hypothetical protein [Rikenellaceae bacterium]